MYYEISISLTMVFGQDQIAIYPRHVRRQHIVFYVCFYLTPS